MCVCVRVCACVCVCVIIGRSLTHELAAGFTIVYSISGFLDFSFPTLFNMNPEISIAGQILYCGTTISKFPNSYSLIFHQKKKEKKKHVFVLVHSTVEDKDPSVSPTIDVDRRGQDALWKQTLLQLIEAPTVHTPHESRF